MGDGAAFQSNDNKIMEVMQSPKCHWDFFKSLDAVISSTELFTPKYHWLAGIHEAIHFKNASKNSLQTPGVEKKNQECAIVRIPKHHKHDRRLCHSSEMRFQSSVGQNTRFEPKQNTYAQFYHLC